MDKAAIRTVIAGHLAWIAGEAAGVQADLRWANLHGADLSGVDLSGVDLSWANLSKANLRGADLRGANLSEAILRGADLRGANLSEAILYTADLRWANLHGADLHGADLSGTNLSGAIGAICAGTDPRDYRFVGISHATGWIIHAGCRWFTMDEAVSHWTAKDNRDALARLAVIAAHTS